MSNDYLNYGRISTTGRPQVTSKCPPGPRSHPQMPEGGHHRPHGDGRQREHGALHRRQVRDLEAHRRLPHTRGQGVQQADSRR